MQKLRRWIKAVGPHHRSRLLVHPNLPEVRGITQGLAKCPTKQEGAINIALNAVVERDSSACARSQLSASSSVSRRAHDGQAAAHAAEAIH
jgi:hypothetical protein